MAHLYSEIEANIYQSKALGSVPAQFGGQMSCECSFRLGDDPERSACGSKSDCINRLTQIECVDGECQCGAHCRNQRFQKREYAPIDIFHTGPKGYGVRCGSELPSNTFVYEYVGEVVRHDAMVRRMSDYAEENIKHFYFMMLQPNEYIDATKKGGKARFLNHSCKPNCVLAKWVVGDKLRMGIFTKRKISSGEELTFNYNADRYGHEPQTCYCGEDNCEGVIGGKTQIEMAGFNELFLRALGVLDQLEERGLTRTKKRKTINLHDEIIPLLSALTLDDVPTMMTALRQATTTRDILVLLLRRIKLTEDDSVKRRLMTMRAFEAITQILQEYKGDSDIKIFALEFVSTCPLMHKNKILSSGLDTAVQGLSEDNDENVQKFVKEILIKWDELGSAYRIPKALVSENGSPLMNPEQLNLFVKRAKHDANSELANSDVPTFIPPAKSHVAHVLKSNKTSLEGTPSAAESQSPSGRSSSSPLVLGVEDIIERTRQQFAAENEKIMQKKMMEEKEVSAEKTQKDADKIARKERTKEKQLKSEFGRVIVQTMSEYKSHFEPEKFKRRAKEITEQLVEKEKRKESYAKNDYKALSKEQTASVRSYTKKFVGKLLSRKGVSN